MGEKWRETMVRQHGTELQLPDTADERPGEAQLVNKRDMIAELSQKQASGGVRLSPRPMQSPARGVVPPTTPAGGSAADLVSQADGDSASAAKAATEAEPALSAGAARPGQDEGEGEGAGSPSTPESAPSESKAEGAAPASSAGELEWPEGEGMGTAISNQEPEDELDGKRAETLSGGQGEAAEAGLAVRDGSSAAQQPAESSIGSPRDPDAYGRLEREAQRAPAEPASPARRAGAAPEQARSQAGERAAAGPPGPGPGLERTAAAHGSPRSDSARSGSRRGGEERDGGRAVSRMLEPELAEAAGAVRTPKAPPSPRSSLDSPRSEGSAESVYSASSSPRRLDRLARSRLGPPGERGLWKGARSAPSSPRGAEALHLVLRTGAQHLAREGAAGAARQDGRGEAPGQAGVQAGDALRRREGGTDGAQGASPVAASGSERRFVKKHLDRHAARGAADAAAADHAAAARPALPGDLFSTLPSSLGSKVFDRHAVTATASSSCKHVCACWQERRMGRRRRPARSSRRRSRRRQWPPL